jgi:hypothetical protein
MPSATAEDAPKAKSSSVVTAILRMVFFMFFSLMDFDFQNVNWSEFEFLRQKHSR